MRKFVLSWSSSFIVFLTVLQVTTGFSCNIRSDIAVKEITNDPWPTPSSMISGIPVYKTFEELESLFHFENDTTYIINFWATWCKPCVEELPYLEDYHEKTKGTKTKVILISLDFPKQIESKLVPFVQERQLGPDVIALLDGKFNKWIDKVSPEWDGTIPATYVYKDARSLFIGEAFHSVVEIEKALNEL